MDCRGAGRDDASNVYGHKQWDAGRRHNSVTLAIRNLPANMAVYIVRYVSGHLRE